MSRMSYCSGCGHDALADTLRRFPPTAGYWCHSCTPVRPVAWLVTAARFEWQAWRLRRALRRYNARYYAPSATVDR